MERLIDSMLDRIFEGLSLKLNIFLGLILTVVGIIMFCSYKKQPSKGKKIVGGICLGIGCIGVFSGIIQFLLG